MSKRNKKYKWSFPLLLAVKLKPEEATLSDCKSITEGAPSNATCQICWGAGAPQCDECCS